MIQGSDESGGVRSDRKTSSAWCLRVSLTPSILGTRVLKERTGETDPLFYPSIIRLLPFISPKHYSLSVSVRSGCFNKNIPLPGWLINSRNLFLTIWRLESPKSICKQIDSDEDILHGLLSYLLPEPSQGRRDKLAPCAGPLLTMALTPIMKAPPSWPIHSPNALPPNAITWRWIWGNTDVQTIEV